MGIRHKLIRFIEQPTGVIDLMNGMAPSHRYYFHTLKRFTESINTYMDIGANEGKVIEACRSVFPNSYVYAIEPIKRHCLKLGKFPNTTVFNWGLWNENTTKTFYHTRNDDCESSLLKPTVLDTNNINRDVEEIIMRVRRLDSLPIEIKSPSFVKLDVEGAEPFVLGGMGDMLDDIDFVQIEQTHVRKNNEKELMSKCMKILEEHGFTGFIQMAFTYLPSGVPSKADLLFFKESRVNKL